MSDYDGDGLSFVSYLQPSSSYHNKQGVVAGKNLGASCFSPAPNDPYKVFLRIKPTNQKNTTHILVDNETIVTEVPKESVSYKVLSRKNNSQIKRKFKFTSVLNDASQKATFEKCVLPALKCFLQGEDCLTMTFGTTSAGKTFTMQGTAEHPGMIPRAISYIFRSLDGIIEHSDRIQPFRGTQLLELDESRYRREHSFKTRILGLDLAKCQKRMDSSYMPFKSYREDETFYSVEFKSMEDNIEMEEGGSPEFFGDRFSVWVSMIEIYNENIIDLLQFHSDKFEHPYLNLGEDDKGGFYVKNVTQVHVNNGHEAYQVNQFGRTNLHRASTALNERSSRSHCIFTMTLVRHQQGGVCLHRFSFVDLAGSERVKKTLNDGKRLLESNSINKSLSVLGKCLHAMKENQNSRTQQIVPVRDSKITKLFKNALVGVEKLTFIINITSNPNLYDETLHVLKFSALAQEILPDVSNQTVRSTSRFSRIFHSNKFREPSFAWSLASSVSDLSEKPDEVTKKQLIVAENRFKVAEQREEELLIEVADLKSQLKESNEAAIKLSELLTKSQEENQRMGVNVMNQFKEAMESKNDYYRNELEIVEKQLQKEKEVEVNYLTEKVDTLKNEIRRLRKKYAEPKVAFDELTAENNRLRIKIEERTTLLDEAVLDYQSILEQAERRENDNAHLMLINEQLTDNITELQVQVEEDKEKMSVLNAQLLQITESHENFKQQVKDQQEKLDSLMVLLEQKSVIENELKVQLEEKCESVEALTLQIREQQDKIELLEKKMVTEEDSNFNNNVMSVLEEKLSEKQTIIDSLTALLQEKGSSDGLSNAQLSESEEKLTQEVCKLKAKIDSLSALLEEKKACEEKSNFRLMETSESEVKLTLEVCELKANIDLLELALKEKSEREEAQLNHLSEFDEKLSEKEAKINSLTALLEEKTACEEMMNSQLKETSESVKLCEQKARIDSLEAILKEKTDRYDEIDSKLNEISNFEENLKEQQAKIDTLTEQLREKIACEEDSKSQFKKMAEYKENLKQQLEEQKSKINTLTEALEKKTNVEEELIAKLKDANCEELNHEKALRDELEKENSCLKKSVKETCGKEVLLRNEINSLKAAISALEQEAVRNNFKDVQCLTEQLKQMELKMKSEESSVSDLKNEINQLRNKLVSQETDNLNARKLIEIEMQSAQKKLETSEYQRRVYLTMKEKADEEAKIIPELKSHIERLENELTNKDQELEAFESKRNFLLSKNEREIKQYQDEVERLKKDVQFGHAVVIENLRNSEKKDQLKKLQDELHSKNMKLLLMEKKSLERSPFKNFTNFVPTGNLVDISPFNVSRKHLRLSKSHENLPFIDQNLNELTASSSIEQLCKVGRESRTPIKTYASDKENINSAEMGSSSRIKTAEKNKKLEASSMESLCDKDNLESKSSPVQQTKSIRKTRTAKKRDPRDHPALSKSAKQSTCRSISPIIGARSVKKQLFSNDDFVELSDDSDFLPPSSPLQAKRTLRPRNRRT